MRKAIDQATVGNLNLLAEFASRSQIEAIVQGLRGEESAYFIGKVAEYAQRIRDMPTTDDREEQHDTAQLHYFAGGADWYITLKDAGTLDEREQHQAFGWARLIPGCGELGYISIVELRENGVELDLHFTPSRLADLPAVKEG